MNDSKPVQLSLNFKKRALNEKKFKHVVFISIYVSVRILGPEVTEKHRKRFLLSNNEQPGKKCKQLSNDSKYKLHKKPHDVCLHEGGHLT